MNQPSEQRYYDQPVRRETFGGLTVEGFSRAAMQTYWRIPELKLGFDLGSQPWSFMGTPYWFVSHTHMDHLLALPAYIARRRMMKMEPPTIFMPEEAITTVRQLLSIFSRLDHGSLPCHLNGVNPGDEKLLSNGLIVSVVKTYHTIPSVGYIVWERRKRLKEKYRLLNEMEIRNLAISGVEVSREIRIPKVAYLGDSRIQALDENPVMLQADILIMELSFVAKRHRGERIHKYGHIHLDDLVDRQQQFQNNTVIASHFSTRYLDIEIETTVRRRLPDMLNGRLVLWF
ncbi:MAG: metal-dependent hydrolase [Planctomycetaceae bacterium]|jgi:ribonuclease Z|nr:metal-dependent hydrolase [Planctomycetaceae bacterium]